MNLYSLRIFNSNTLNLFTVLSLNFCTNIFLLYSRMLELLRPFRLTEHPEARLLQLEEASWALTGLVDVE